MKKNREFLMLASIYDPLKSSPAGMFCSEKLDGVRAIWIPSTRNREVGKIPFANLQKDVTGNAFRLASGLWSRYGKPIWAPNSWLDELPKNRIIDGELYVGRGKFQDVISTTRKKDGLESEWSQIKFMALDSPPLDKLFLKAKIHNTIWQHFHFPSIEEMSWVRNGILPFDVVSFEFVYAMLKREQIWNDVVQLHKQTPLPFKTKEAQTILDDLLNQVISVGGEGLILRGLHSTWEPTRSKEVLKLKPFNDSEGTIVGFTWGKGRLEGMLGSLEIKWENPDGKDIIFNLSGMDDKDREIVNGTTPKNPAFKIGSKITFRYRELTNDGQPKEARYHRPFSEG